MLVSQNIINHIDDIVERAYIDFTYLLVGDEFFTTDQKRMIESLGLIVGRKPLIELLYTLVRQRSHPNYKDDRTLQQLLDDLGLRELMPITSDSQQYTLDHAKRIMYETLDQTKIQFARKLKQVILQANNEYKNYISLNPPKNVEFGELKRYEATEDLLKKLEKPFTQTQSEFVRDFTVNMTDTINNSVVDNVAVTAGAAGLALATMKVYKKVINDGSLCPWCSSFYTNPDGTPKVYNMLKLAANGSNAGKPKSLWKPVIGSTHPRCRCELKYLLPGQKPIDTE
jgi:hypothetical protein